MYELNGHYLCLDHYNVIAQNAQVAQQNNMAMMNFLRDQIHETMGLSPPQARIEIPKHVLNHSPVTYNHIQVNDSVVGSINTAQVGRIDIAMEKITNGGDQEVAKAIKALTEAIIDSKDATEELKNQIVEQLGFLADQATLSKEHRQTSVVSMVLNTLAGTIGIAADLTALWVQWGPILNNFFHQA